MPIVEPEVLMDGAHTIERCYEATERTLRAVFRCLYEQRVPLEEIAAQAEHGALGQELSAAGERARGRRADAALLPQHRAGRRAGHRVPLRAARATSWPPRT